MEDEIDDLAFELALKNLRVEVHKKMEDGSDEMIWRYGWNSKEIPDRNKCYCGNWVNPHHFTSEETQLLKKIFSLF